jgi:hypothetical protein
MYRGSPPVTSLRRIPAYILLLSQLHTIHTFKRLFSQLHSLRRVQRTANEKPVKPHNPFFPTLAAAKRPAHFAACNAALVSTEWMTQRTARDSHTDRLRDSPRDKPSGQSSQLPSTQPSVQPSLLNPRVNPRADLLVNRPHSPQISYRTSSFAAH